MADQLTNLIWEAHKEFSAGVSVPRNKELMRVFKDLDMVEHLGSGIPRILESYDKEAFKFSDNFLRMTFPKAIIDYSGVKDGGQDGGQVGCCMIQVRWFYCSDIIHVAQGETA